VVGGQVESGQDVFGGSFTRLEGFVRYDGNVSGLAQLMDNAFSSSDGEVPLLKSAELCRGRAGLTPAARASI